MAHLLFVPVALTVWVACTFAIALWASRGCDCESCRRLPGRRGKGAS